MHWTTRDVGFPEVRWGTSPGKHTTIAGGISTTYNREGVLPVRTWLVGGGGGGGGVS